jgi:leucyl/phenylalanyl-tRNA--protein transferase
MQTLMNKDRYRVSIDEDFDSVIETCSQLRIDEEYAWLGPQMVEAYKELHRQGFAISVEVWNGQKFVGGLYGVTIGLSFFGESMCSLEPNASKLALIHLAQTMQKTGGQLIDCQFHTPHLESMGGRHIDYGEYMRIISSCNTSAPQASNPESA